MRAEGWFLATELHLTIPPQVLHLILPPQVLHLTLPAQVLNLTHLYFEAPAPSIIEKCFFLS